MPESEIKARSSFVVTCPSCGARLTYQPREKPLRKLCPICNHKFSVYEFNYPDSSNLVPVDLYYSSDDHSLYIVTRGNEHLKVTTEWATNFIHKLGAVLSEMGIPIIYIMAKSINP